MYQRVHTGTKRKGGVGGESPLNLENLLFRRA